MLKTKSKAILCMVFVTFLEIVGGAKSPHPPCSCGPCLKSVADKKLNSRAHVIVIATSYQFSMIFNVIYIVDFFSGDLTDQSF